MSKNDFTCQGCYVVESCDLPSRYFNTRCPCCSCLVKVMCRVAPCDAWNNYEDLVLEAVESGMIKLEGD